MLRIRPGMVVAAVAAALALASPVVSVAAASTGTSSAAAAVHVQGAAAVRPAWAGECVLQGSNVCWGLDPTTTSSNSTGTATCSSDAVTTNSATLDGVQMQIRYSANCGAKWVKVFNLPSGWDFYAEDGWGNKLNWSQHHYGGTSAGMPASWTGMVDGSRTAQGCFLNGACISG